MRLSEALLGITIIILAVIVANPVSGFLRRYSFPMNP